jgi:hypothetical protein
MDIQWKGLVYFSGMETFFNIIFFTSDFHFIPINTVRKLNDLYVEYQLEDINWNDLNVECQLEDINRNDLECQMKSESWYFLYDLAWIYSGKD